LDKNANEWLWDKAYEEGYEKGRMEAERMRAENVRFPWLILEEALKQAPGSRIRLYHRDALEKPRDYRPAISSIESADGTYTDVWLTDHE
jgi:hypothetical protein